MSEKDERKEVIRVMVTFLTLVFPIARGAFGVVHRAIERATTKNWAAKFVRCRPGDKDLVRREIELMNSLHHPKLLQLHEAFDQTGEMVMILEL